MVTDCKNNCVYFYSHPGQHVTCLQLSRDVNPWQALIGQCDGYVISYGHPIPCQLLWVNSAGDEALSYTDQPDVRPHHMIDDGTYLLVADLHNHCVHRVRRKGKHDGHLITDIDPTCICLDPA